MGAGPENSSTPRSETLGNRGESGHGHQCRHRPRHRSPPPANWPSAPRRWPNCTSASWSRRPGGQSRTVATLVPPATTVRRPALGRIVAASYGQLAAAVVAVGRQPRARTMDLLIAATAHAHDRSAHTRNAADLKGADQLIEVVSVVTRPGSANTTIARSSRGARTRGHPAGAREARGHPAGQEVVVPRGLAGAQAVPLTSASRPLAPPAPPPPPTPESASALSHAPCRQKTARSTTHADAPLRSTCTPTLHPSTSTTVESSPLTACRPPSASKRCRRWATACGHGRSSRRQLHVQGRDLPPQHRGDRHAAPVQVTGQGRRRRTTDVEGLPNSSHLEGRLAVAPRHGQHLPSLRRLLVATAAGSGSRSANAAGPSVTGAHE